VIGAFAVNVVSGYVLGSIPFGLVVGHLYLGRDIRDSGSGKTGTTNVLRTAGRSAAALVLVGDISKGAVPALLGRFLFHDDWVAATGAAAAICGHVWPVFASFRGGRGVASTYGGVLGLTPLLSLAFPVVGLLLIVSTRVVSVMSIVGTPVCALAVVLAAVFFGQPWAYATYAVFATVLVEYKHIPNIQRLLAGTEPRIGQGGSQPATG
jgi:acyl phosphate:glycerol-3-phosphate acyltransferase